MKFILVLFTLLCAALAGQVTSPPDHHLSYPLSHFVYSFSDAEFTATSTPDHAIARTQNLIVGLQPDAPKSYQPSFIPVAAFNSSSAGFGGNISLPTLASSGKYYLITKETIYGTAGITVAIHNQTFYLY